MANGYRDALVQQIKDAGQELINRAETMVHPENDLITDFSIVIHFEQHEVPTIDYTTSVINKVACDRVTRSIVEEILEMIRTKLTEVENAEN